MASSSSNGSVEIMMACTSLKNDSTLMVAFDEIDGIIRDNYSEEKTKNMHVISLDDLEDESIGRQRLVDFGYVLINPNNRKISLTNYFKESRKRFDIIFLASCNNLVDLFSDKLKQPVIESVDNIELFYRSIKNNGLVIIIYEPDSKLVDVEKFSAYTSLRLFEKHVIFTIIFNELFDRISEGVYVKKRIVYPDRTIAKAFEKGLRVIDEMIFQSDNLQQSLDEILLIYFGVSTDEVLKEYGMDPYDAMKKRIREISRK